MLVIKHLQYDTMEPLTTDISIILDQIKILTENNDIPVNDEFNSFMEFHTYLENSSAEIKAGNKESLKKLGILFLPTGFLQDVSILNGWSETYLKLAEEFDRIANEIYN